MATRQPFVHPKMLERNAVFFNATCTVERQTGGARDPFGEHQPSWQAVITDVPCRIAPSGGREVKQPNQTYAVSTHHIMLLGYYTEIDASMRALVDGKQYNIMLVEHDYERRTTRLTVEVVTHNEQES